jgi:hypothetical protein
MLQVRIVLVREELLVMFKAGGSVPHLPLEVPEVLLLLLLMA